MSRVADLVSPTVAAAAFGKSQSRLLQLVYEHKLRRYRTPDSLELAVSMSEVKRWYTQTLDEQRATSAARRVRGVNAMDLLGFYPPTLEDDAASSTEGQTVDPSDLIGVPEVARLIGVSPATVHRMIRDGVLHRYGANAPNRAPNARIYVSRKEVEEHVAVYGVRRSALIRLNKMKAEVAKPEAPQPPPVASPPGASDLFLRLIAERETYRKTEPHAHAHFGYDAGLRAALRAGLSPSWPDYGYFCGFMGWNLEISPDTEEFKAAKLSWADGLWDRAQRRPYTAPGSAP
jgi:predicted DNA-binding transcriptional regulator AlpA